MGANMPLPIPSRRGKQNRSSMTVKLAFNHMKFDAVVEWVKAYKELGAISPESSAEQLEIVKTKFKALERVFEHMFPKIKEVDQETADSIEMQDLEVLPSDQSTDQLMEALIVETEQAHKA